MARGGFQVCDFGELDEVAPAYAVTIHKIEGIGVSSSGDPAGHATLHAAATEPDLHGYHAGQKAGGAHRAEESLGHRCP
jgi:hypothetical protein